MWNRMVHIHPQLHLPYWVHWRCCLQEAPTLHVFHLNRILCCAWGSINCGSSWQRCVFFVDSQAALYDMLSTSPSYCDIVNKCHSAIDLINLRLISSGFLLMLVFLLMTKLMPLIIVQQLVTWAVPHLLNIHTSMSKVELNYSSSSTESVTYPAVLNKVAPSPFIMYKYYTTLVWITEWQTWPC